MLGSARHGEGASQEPCRCIRVPERCACRVQDGERWLRELCVSLGSPVPTPSEPEVPKSRCWQCPGRCCHGQGAGWTERVHGWTCPCEDGEVRWRGCSGGSLSPSIPPSPISHPLSCPVPSLLPLPSATCLLAVPSMSSPPSLVVPPNVWGSTDPNKGIQCHYLCS